MATDESELLLPAFTKRLEVAGPANSGDVFVAMGILQLLYGLSLVFVLFVTDD